MPLAARFQTFGSEHVTLILVCLAGCVAMVLLGRRGDRPGFRRAFAVVIPVVTVPFQALQLLPDDFTPGTSLPLQVCDLAWPLAVYALWTTRPWAVSMLYLWGLTLVPQAILTPSLDQAFPDPRYFMFWAMHFVAVWAAVYLVSAGHRPDWRGYRVALGLTAGWAVSMMVLNALIGTNFGYLNRKPASASALDLLGPWPAYVVIEAVIVAAGWALITWPWVRGAGGPRSGSSVARVQTDPRSSSPR